MKEKNTPVTRYCVGLDGWFRDQVSFYANIYFE